MSVKTIVLAAGKGTRMKSAVPKVLHKVMEKSMIEHVLDRCHTISEELPIVIVGYKGEQVEHALQGKAVFAIQEEQLGTGHAVKMGLDHINEDDTVLIICGDTPLIRKETLQAMVEHYNKGYAAVIMSSVVEDPTGYGRVITDENGSFLKIVEHKDATRAEKEVDEINGGTYLISGKYLIEGIRALKNDNAQGEYYLTDVFAWISDEYPKEKVGVYPAQEWEILGINSRVQLAQAEKSMRLQINRSHMENGVTIIDPDCTYIEDTVEIGADTMIYPGCRLSGNTKIGEFCVIREHTTIEDCVIGSHVTIKNSVLLQSQVGIQSTIGPFAYLRPNSVIGAHCKIGDFVEVKNAKIGDHTKASHLSYIGDATVGSHVNIGCGTVFVNYDGERKYHTDVDDYAFIGSNSNLIAPVHIGKHALVAAGSTITVDIPSEALVVARNREYIKENWNKPTEKK